VGDLRGFARHDEARVGVADVRDGLESTLNLLRGGFGTRIAFNRDYAKELPRIECHPAQLNQVFLNLLLNAVESIEGQGEITIRAEPGDGGGVVVTISDSGRGIPEGVRARVWEPFFTTKPRRDGAGLGLTICRTIVERHGGTITLEPSQPHGTRVRVALPRRGVAS
jgi:two-component system, NtrC family, sensor kinase